MKRHGNLFPQITDFGNLLLAAKRAQACKRYRDDVLHFNYHLEANLHQLRRELLEGSYQPGSYRAFVIYEPKRRLICAAPYRDRVVHHALCNVIEPIFNRTFVDSCYANRVGKGTHKALDHFVGLARTRRFCLRADVRKYFPSIDHDLLKAIIRRKLKCPETLALIDRILDHAPPQEPVDALFPGDDLFAAARRKGLPIGNLTSQLWANVYLNEVDHAMAERFGGTRYVRYVDDFALFCDDREELVEARAFLAEELARLRLKLHPSKTEVHDVRRGVNFLGFRIFPERIRVRQENLTRARRRMRQLKYELDAGLIDIGRVSCSVQSWIAHVAYGDTWRLRTRFLESFVF